MKLGHNGIHSAKNSNSSPEEVVLSGDQTAQKSFHLLVQNRTRQSRLGLNCTLGILVASASISLFAALLFMTNQISKETAVVVVNIAVRVAEINRQYPKKIRK